MRELFPKNNSTDILGKDSDIVKKEDLLPITEQLQNTIQQLNILSDSLTQYETDNTQAINTTQLNAVNAAIQALEAVNSELTNAEVDNLTVSSLAQLTNMTTQVATILTSLTSPEITSEDIRTENLQSVVATFSTLEAQAAEIQSWTLHNFNVDNISISEKITTNELEADVSSLGAASATSLDVSGAVSTGNIEAENIVSDSITTDEVATENIHWTGTVNLTGSEVFYIGVPHFENGQYYIQLLDESTPFATIEIFNSVDNFFVRWSQSNYNQLTHIYKYENDTSTQLYFKVENESGNALTMKYATTCITPNVQGPTSYVSLPIEDYQDYEIRYKDGSKFFKNVDFASQGGTVGILRELVSNDITDATDNVSYDTTVDTDIIIYQPDQSVNTNDDVKFNQVDTTFLNVREFTTRNFVATELHTLSTIDLSQYDDGAIVVVRIGSTSASPQPSAAYVKMTENNTPVLYKLIIGKNLPASGSNTNKPLIWSVADQAIIEGTNYSIAGTIDVGGNATFGGNITATGDITADNIALSGNATITGDISANDITGSGDLSLTGDATIGGNATITGDAVVHGDLYVDGTTHTTTEESISTTGDTITLRQNNSTSLGADYSGIIINKYDGTHDLALVSDSDGTMRVGTGSGTETTYTNIYWDDDTEKWYSDAALTTEVSPSGNLSSWSSLEINGDVKHYTNAVFTAITYTTLVPLLARDEATNLDNKAILAWDSTGNIAKTIPAPTVDETLLQANIDSVSGDISYSWEDPITPITQDITQINQDIAALPRPFVFATMADYTAAASTVPNGSVVYIENEENYLVGD